MKKFNDYLTIIQELGKADNSNDNSNNDEWKEATVGDGLVDDEGNTVFDYSELLDDFEDPILKNEWLKMEAKKLKGLGLINYSNAGYDVFTADKGKTFLYRETPSFNGIIETTIRLLTTKLNELGPKADKEAFNETNDELKGYKELEKILKDEDSGPFGKLIIQKYNDYDTVPKSRAFREAANFFGLEID